MSERILYLYHDFKLSGIPAQTKDLLIFAAMKAETQLIEDFLNGNMPADQTLLEKYPVLISLADSEVYPKGIGEKDAPDCFTEGSVILRRGYGLFVARYDFKLDRNGEVSMKRVGVIRTRTLTEEERKELDDLDKEFDEMLRDRESERWKEGPESIDDSPEGDN